MNTCYICLDIETEIRPFAKTSPCSCKGTMVIHEHCAEQIKNNRICMQCRSNFTEEPCFDQNDYTVDPTNMIYYKSHGLTYIYTRATNDRKMLFAILEYHNGVLQDTFNIVFPGYEKEIDLSKRKSPKSIRQEYLEHRDLPLADLC